MKMRRWLMGVMSAVLCLSVVAGCGGNGNARKESNELVINISSEPPQMNPALTTDTTSGNVFRHVSEGLVSLDANDEAQPGVAESWETTDNGKTVTFKLNPDAKWANGEQVTANDFVFGWNTLFTPATGSSYAGTWAPLIVGAEDILFSASNVEKAAVEAGRATMVDQKDKEGNPIKVFTPVSDAEKEAINNEKKAALEVAIANAGYKAIDDTTFEVKLTGPYPYFVPLMSFYSFLPVNEKMYNEMGGLDAYGTEVENFASNGPYTMTSWAHESEIVIEKNENYWNKDAIKMEKITMRMITDTNTSMTEFESGNMDMVGLTGEQLEQFKKEDKAYYSYDDGGNWYFEYNVQKKPFTNKKVRKALTEGINVAEYVDAIVMNDSKAGQSFTPPAIQQGKFADKVGTLYDRSDDFSAAKALLEEGLAEEGMTIEDFTFTLLGDEGDSAQKSYAFFQEQWKKNLGVEVEISQVPFKSRLAQMDAGDFDVVYAGWGPDYNDPMTFIDLLASWSGNNHAKWSNARYDELIKLAMAEPNAETREGYLLECEKIIADEVPFGIIYYRTKDYALAEGLKGVNRTAFSDIDVRYAYWADAE